MNDKLKRIAERRAYLINQAARQRHALARDSLPWRHLLQRADQGIAAIRYLKSHPLWLVGGSGVLLTLLGPGRVWRWLGRGWVGLQMLNRLRPR